MKTNTFSQRLLALLLAMMMLCSVVPAATLFSAAAAKTSAGTVQKKLSKATVTVASTVKYTGKAKKPVVQVTYGKKKLTQGVHYTVKYLNNVNVGVAKVKITAKKNSGFTGSKTVKFKILPAKTAGLKATKCTQNYIKLSWSPVKGATGYVLYTYNAATKTYKKLKAVNKTSAIATKLTAGTTYRFAVRAYTRVNNKNYYGTFSKVRKAATLAAPVPVSEPVSEPASEPVSQPTSEPASQPTSEPSSQPASQPSSQPASQPTTEPTTEPTTQPAAQPSSPLDKSAVTGLKAVKNGSKVVLTWNAVSGATGYEVCTYNAAAKTYKVLSTASSNSATLTNLKMQGKVEFAVRAYQTANGATEYGAYSETASVTMHYVDYYAEVFKKGEYTVKMKVVLEGDDAQEMTLAAKNGNINMKTTVEGISAEMRYIKRSNKLYVNAMGMWIDGNSMLGDDTDMLSQMNIFAALDLDDLDNVTVTSERVGDKAYTVETVTGKNSVNKFYFSGDSLKRIVNTGSGMTNTMEILSFSDSANDSLFTEPLIVIDISKFT